MKTGKAAKIKQIYDKMSIQAKAAIWYTVCNVIQKGLIFLTTPVFSRLLTTEEYGIYSVFSTWQSVIIILVSLNLASGVYLRGLIKYEEDEEEFSASLHSLFAAVFFIGFLIYLVWHGFFSRLLEIPFNYMMCMFADMLMAVSFHFWSAKQRVDYKYRSLIAVTIANSILKPAMEITAIALFADNVTARIYALTAADVVCFGALFAGMWTGAKKVSTKYWGYALRYNIPLVPHYLSQIVLNQSDRVMIKRLIGASQAGIYTLAYTLASIMVVLNQAILNSFNPWMYRQIKNRKFQDIGRYSMGLLLMLAGGNLCVIILAPELIAVMAPGSYHEAIWLMPPVTMSIFFMFMYSLFANFEFYFEKTQFMMVASVSGALLNIVLNYIFIQIFGYVAAGYTTLVCYLCYCIAHYLVMRRILKKELPGEQIYDLRQILAISGAFMASGFSIMLFYERPIIRYMIFLVIVGIAFRNRKKILAFLNLVKAAKKS